MMTDTRTLDDPRLRPFLPMLYIAWVDGDLVDEEVEAICPQLDESCQSLLRPWLDASQPPTANELQRMLVIVRQKTADVDIEGKLDLTGLGLHIAQADSEISGVEREALVNLERALGIASTEAARQLLTTRRMAHRQPEPEASFDIEALTAYLHRDYAKHRQAVFELLEEDGFDFPYDIKKDEHRELVLAWCRRLAQAGLGSLSFPQSCGGEDDLGAFISSFEALAHFDLSLVIKYGVQFGLFGGSVLNLGSEFHHERYLTDIGTLELPGCFAMTETGHGSNVADLETVANYDAASQEFIIHTPHPGARKDYIGNAAKHGRMATVFAQLELGENGQGAHGVHAFLVPIRDEQGQALPGIWIGDCGDKMGLQGVDNGRLAFDQVRIPRANLLDRFASVAADGTYSSPISSPSKRFFTMLGTLVGGRVSVALAALSVAKSALAIAVRYGARRRQFGPAATPETRLLNYPSHQVRLLPRLAESYGLHFALSDLRRRFVGADASQRRQLETEAAGLKAASTWHATDSVQTGRECCGGQGYLAENRFAALKADSDVFTTFEGDNVVLLQLVAKSMLGGYKRQFGDMKVLGLVRYLAERTAISLAELNPLTTRNVADDHLLDRDFHLAAFRWREHQLVSSVARRLKKRLDRGASPADALLECQDHLLAAARAHVETHVLECFAVGVESCPQPDGQAILAKLCDLHAVARLHADRGFFLEQGYFESNKSKAIRKMLLRLCGEVRQQAVPLVDAFGIPQRLLAPIAT